MNQEFESFFNETRDNHIMMLKRDSTLSNTTLIMSKNKKIIYSPLVIMGESVSPFEIARSVIEQSKPEFYIVIAMAWGSKFPILQDVNKIKRGDISRLPAKQRFEVLSFVGRTRDGYELKNMYEVKRAEHGNDESKVLDIIDMGKDYDNMKVFHLP